MDIDSPMVACHHASAQFAGEKGISEIIRIIFAGLCRKLLGGYDGRISERPEQKCFTVISRHFIEASVPESIHVVAIKRNNLSVRYRCGKFGPAGSGVKWHIKTQVNCHFLKSHQLITLTAKFIF